MSKFKYYIKSARLRTLPLSLSGIITGIAVASMIYEISIGASVLVCLTAIFLQILSNVSNEYGDYLSGTDNENRLGPQYSAGNLSEKEIRKMIAANIVLSCISGIAMICCAFGTLFSLKSLFFIILGACAVIAALKYTLGKNPYGYRAKGDIFVFIFFGLATVLGSIFIVSDNIPRLVDILPAATIGFFSIGVLNINNIRDIETDAATRVTTAIKLGERKSKIYHIVLISAGWICYLAYYLINNSTRVPILPFVTILLYAFNCIGVWKKSGKGLDPMLPLLVMSTFLFSILFAISI